MSQNLKWQQASTQAADPNIAVSDIYQQLTLDNPALIICYCSPGYNREQLAEALNQHFAGLPLIACTTAGAISQAGYNHSQLVALSLDQADFQVQHLRIDNLQQFNMANTQRLCNALRAQINTAPEQHFGFLLVDGLSKREEVVVSTLYEALDGIPLFGGSAADGLNFEQTHIYHQGQFHSDCALLTLIQTRHPFHVFKTEHFHATDKNVVVTEADAAERIVYEFNGAPAAQEYARLLGLSVEALAPPVYAVSPLVVKVAGQYHVRSILGRNPDDSLSFYCAIDTGVVLRIAECGDLIANLHNRLEHVSARFGEPDLILGCDCILRRLEIERKHLHQPMQALIEQYNLFAFNTYGEQLNALHINQTFTGVAITAK